MRQFFWMILCSIVLMIVSACSSDTSLPTLQPTVDSGGGQVSSTEDSGSGFDPNLGGDNNTDTEPTPTRETDANIGGDIESGARGTGFNAQIVNGSIDAVNDGGQYDCTVAGHRIASGVTAAPNITLTLPVEEPIGTFTFVGAEDGGEATAVVTLASVDETYTQVTGGTVTINEVPRRAGEFISGEFDFVVLTDGANEIGVRGDFAFEATGAAYCSF